MQCKNITFNMFNLQTTEVKTFLNNLYFFDFENNCGEQNPRFHLD